MFHKGKNGETTNGGKGQFEEPRRAERANVETGPSYVTYQKLKIQTSSEKKHRDERKKRKNKNITLYHRKPNHGPPQKKVLEKSTENSMASRPKREINIDPSRHSNKKKKSKEKGRHSRIPTDAGGERYA